MDDLIKTDYSLALATITTAIISERRKRKNDPTRLQVRTLADYLDEPVKSREDSLLDRIIESPLEGAYLLAVYRIGKALNEAGGFELMQEISGLAIGDDDDAGARLTIIEKYWDGIGSWMS